MPLTPPPRWAALAFAALAAAGCSTDPRQPYPVQGVVVYDDGQPAKELAGSLVTFTPLSSEARGSSVGTVQEDGTFRLSCRKEGDGAVAGRHRVTISLPEREEEGDIRPKTRRPAPKTALDPATAVQEVTVEPKTNQITLTVKRAAGRAS
jgi:hypothetical protein